MADATFLVEIIVRARRELAGVMEKAARDIDKVTGAEERHAKSTKKVTEATNTTNKAVADLNKSYEKYIAELESGNRSTDEAADHLKRFGREFDKLANRAEAGSEVADSLLKAAKAAKSLVVEVEAARKKQTAQVEESYKQAAQIDKAYDELEKTRVANAKKAADEEEIALKKRQAFVMDILQEVNDDEARRAQDRVKIAQAEQEDFDRVQDYRLASMSAADKKVEEEARAHQAKIKEIEKSVQTGANQAEKIRTDGLKVRQKLENEIAAAQKKFQLDSIDAQGKEKLANLEREHSQRNLRDEIDQTIRSYDDFIDRVRQGDVRGSQVKVGLQQHAQTLAGVTRRSTTTFGAGSDESLHVGGRETEARSLVKDIGREAGIATPKVVGFGSAIQRLFNVDTGKADAIQASIDKTEDALGKASFQAIHFAGVLRSLVYVGAIVFFEELTSAAIALAGALVAVASTAVQAGGALVGALAAGAAQALPIIGLLGAAWGRVGAVFDAVKQNIKQQTQAGYEQVQAAKAQTDAAVRLTAAQEALNAAQKQAARDIQDLEAAQRSAQLQAERSILSQSDAQVALTSALRTGDVGSVASLSLRTRETAFDASQARTNLFRSTADAREAQSQGVNGRPNVVAARRELEAAKRAADDAADSVSAADRSLQQMLADLSPAERRLYDVLNRVVKKYREVFTGEGGILESITDAFTFGAERVLKLFDDSRLVDAARNLADEIAKQLRRAFSEASGSGTRSFVADLADDARRNLPYVTEFAIQIAKIAGVIIKAGGPALTRFLDFFTDLATKGAQATGSDSALQKLTDFFLKGEEYAEDITLLAIAVGQLISAIVTTAAPEGQTAIESIIGAIKSATQYINENKDGVRQFFHDAVQASGVIAGALAKLAVGLFGLFKADRVKTFADAFTKTFLPAILSVIQVVGVLTNVFLRFAGTGTGSVLFQFLIMMTGIVKVIGPMIGLFARLGRSIAVLLGMEKVVFFFNRFLFFLGPIGLAVAAITSALILLDGKFHIFQKFKDLFTSAADKSREAADKFTDSINRQIDALRRQRDAELARQGSRLSLARAEIAAEKATQDAKKVGGIDLKTGAIEKGAEVTDARRDASLNLKQSLLDEKQARVDLADARKADKKAGEDAVSQSKKTLDAAKQSVGALKDERSEIEKRIDAAKREVEFQKKLRDQQVPGTRDYATAQSQLKDAQNKLKDAQSDLKDNTKNLRSEADKATSSFRRWRTAVKRAGSNTESFSDDVHAAMDSVVSDVNEVLVEFGAKPLKWKSSAKKTPTQKLSGASDIFDTPDIGGFPGRQQGGMAPSIIPGSGDGDKVHVMAEPGEGFINKTAVKALGGPRVIDWINNKLAPRFQRGGIVQIPGAGGNGQGVDSRILGDVVSLIRRFKALVTAGYAPTGHKAAGEHPLGLAVDLVPNTAVGGTWDDIDKLAHYAEPSQNNPRPPWRFVGYDGDVGHGRGNHLHLSWLHEGLKTVETLKGAAGLAFEVAKRKISGPAGALTSLFQGASNKVVTAANRFLAKKTTSNEFSGGAAGSGTDVKLGPGGPGKRIFDYFVAQGFSQNQAAAWVGNATQESGLSPNAIENNGKGPGHGLFQWSFGRYAALLAYAKKRGTDWNDEQTQLDFTMHELGGSESAAYSRIKAAKSLAAAVAAIGQGYERFGVEGNRLGPARDALKAFGNDRTHGGSFASGGEVAGPVGKAVNIIAHAKEWVVNQGQQGKLAAMLGTSVHGLRSMLGFSGGPSSFAGGGEVGYSIPSTLGTGPNAITKEASRANKVIDQLKSSLINSKFTDKLSLSIKALVGDGGLFDLLSTSISDLSDKLSVGLGKLAFKITKAGNVVRGLTTQETAAKSLANLERVYGDLVGERGAIQRQLTDVAKRLKNSKLSSGERALLESTKTNLSKRLQDVQGLINQSLADQFQGVEDIIQASVDAAQNQHDDSTFKSTIQARLRAIAGNDLSAAVGLPTPGQIARIQSDALNVQANNVANAARTAQRAGHSDTAKALLKTVEDLRTQALELVAQGIRDDVAVIDAQASRRQARIDLSGRAADLLERVGNTAGAFALRATNLQNTGSSLATQRAGLVGQLAAAQATGNGALVEELSDRIADLDQTIAENVVALQENTTAARAAAINAITQRGSNLGGIFSGVQGIFTALGDLTGTTNTAGITAALKSAGTVLQQTGSGLAQKLFEGFGIDLRNLDPQSIADKLLGTDFDAVTANLSPGDKSQFFDLINSIIDNTTATVGNTKQLNDIVSPSSQSFSSTAWTNFRRAIFNGAGGLIPKFDMAVPALAGGGDIIRGGLVEVHNNERVLTAAQVRKTSSSEPGGDTINVAVTHPVERFDPVDGARQMVHEFRKKKGGGS